MIKITQKFMPLCAPLMRHAAC